MRVSSGVAQGLLVHQVTPQYPPLARRHAFREQMVLQAVIGEQGCVPGQNPHGLSGRSYVNDGGRPEALCANGAISRMTSAESQSRLTIRLHLSLRWSR